MNLHLIKTIDLWFKQTKNGRSRVFPSASDTSCNVPVPFFAVISSHQVVTRVPSSTCSLTPSLTPTHSLTQSMHSPWKQQSEGAMITIRGKTENLKCPGMLNWVQKRFISNCFNLFSIDEFVSQPFQGRNWWLFNITCRCDFCRQEESRELIAIEMQLSTS